MEEGYECYNIVNFFVKITLHSINFIPHPSANIPFYEERTPCVLFPFVLSNFINNKLGKLFPPLTGTVLGIIL